MKTWWNDVESRRETTFGIRSLFMKSFSLRELIWDKQMTSHMLLPWSQLHQEVSREFQTTNMKVKWQREVCCPSFSSLPLVLSQQPETSAKLTEKQTEKQAINCICFRWQQEYGILAFFSKLRVPCNILSLSVCDVTLVIQSEEEASQSMGVC